MSSSKRHNWVAVLLIILLAGCGDTNDSGNSDSQAGVKAPVATAEETTVPLYYEAAGTIQSMTAGTLSAKIMGTVLTVHVKEGDRVKAGDLLVSIDNRQVAAQFAQARAAVSEAAQGAAAAESAKGAAQAGADLAAATYERYKKLLTDDSVSRQEYDEVAARYQQAQSALKQAQGMAAAAHARVRQTESGLMAASVTDKDASVQAPFDGIVSAKLIEEGDLATPGKPLLTLESETGFEMAVDLPETLFASVEVGGPVTIRIPALNDLSLAGQVAAVSPAADARSRSFLVKITLPENTLVHAGMFARAEIPTGEERILLIPRSAVLHQGHLTGVFVLDDLATARFRLIRTGRDMNGAVEIISGLKPGMRFVAQPPPTLTDGNRVEAL